MTCTVTSERPAGAQEAIGTFRDSSAATRAISSPPVILGRRLRRALTFPCPPPPSQAQPRRLLSLFTPGPLGAPSRAPLQRSFIESTRTLEDSFLSPRPPAVHPRQSARLDTMARRQKELRGNTETREEVDRRNFGADAARQTAPPPGFSPKHRGSGWGPAGPPRPEEPPKDGQGEGKRRFGGGK
uniref:Uncharacterized protein n=1 Tax=Chromera velia CCMP2878 TaxID=1169474 RepID=A0A0G4FH30_9ALVE|eukprot:Cvel_16966.t1-p1 / transcript=Cvel_16966.t1 / gene=Cvel_16966 / organism=Chromera_velia_CCMP2878 / gene_product=hypothetical protein / transcript_product=hypothetical protein / location=Cvel_scaffold1331:33591-36490(-) / protein_length=184 / sequence_SO=supercontig / SO=protein_coding / is_pseudo=false